MAVVNDSVEMFAGNRRVLRYTIVDEADQPLNLTGFTVKWALAKIKNQRPLEPPVLQRSSATGGHMTITPALGVVEVILAEGLTAGLEGLHYAELEIFDASSNSTVVATGNVDIKRNLANT